MTPNSPHYLLFSEASRDEASARCWRFVLQNVETQRRFSATDTEPVECGERLELLAVVRGLEALDGPSRVTLVTKSRYVSRGIKSGLAEWRRNGWNWERFGRMVPVRDCDLWQRVDRALGFHQVSCQAWQFDNPIEEPESQQFRPSRVDSAEPAARRRVRPMRRSLQGAVSARKESSPAASQAGRQLMDRVRGKIRRVGHLPEVVRSLTRPMGHTPGAPA